MQVMGMCRMSTTHNMLSKNVLKIYIRWDRVVRRYIYPAARGTSVYIHMLSVPWVISQTPQTRHEHSLSSHSAGPLALLLRELLQPCIDLLGLIFIATTAL